MVALVIGAIGSAAPSRAAEFSYLEGHTQGVYAVAWTADGSRIVSGSFDHTAKVWDRASGTAIRTLADHSHLVLAVTVSADGKQLATAGLDKQIYLYELPTVQPTLEISDPRGANRLAASADGKWFVTGTADGTLHRYQAETASYASSWPHAFAPHAFAATKPEDAVVSLAVSGDGAMAAAALQGGQLLAFRNVPEGAAERHRIPTPEPISAFTARPDLQAVAVGSPSGKVRLYRWPPPAPREIAADLPGAALLAAPDGTWLAAVSPQGAVKVFNVADGKLRTEFQHGFSISSTALNGDGTRLATVDSQGQVKVWDTANGSLVSAVNLRPLAIPLSVANLAAPDRWVVTAGSELHVLQFDLPPGLDVAVGSTAPRAHALSSDGRLLAVADQAEAVRVVQLVDGAVKHTFAIAGSAANALAFTADGTRLLSGGEDGRVRVHHLTSGGTLVIEGQGAPITTLDPLGRTNVAAVGDRTGQIKLWNLTDGSLAKELTKQPSAVRQLTAYEDRELYSMTEGEPVVVRWNIADPAPMAAPIRERVGAKSRLGGDGSLLALITGDEYLGVHKLRESGSQLGFSIAGQSLQSLTFNAPGTHLLAVHQDGAAQISAVNFPQFFHQFRLPAGVVASYLTPDAATVVMLSTDGHVRTQAAPRHRGGFGSRGGGGLLVAAAADPMHCFTADDDGKFKLWNLETGQVERDDALAGRVLKLTTSPDRQRLALELADGTVSIRSAVDGAAMTEFAAGSSSHYFNFSPDGQRLVSGKQILDAATGAVIESFGDPNDEASAAVLLKDSAAVLLKDGQTLARVVDAKIQLSTVSALLAEVQAHTGPVTALEFSSRGGQLLSTGEDGQVVQWRTSDLAEVRRYGPLPAPARRLAADAPGRLIAIAAEHPEGGGQVQLWQAVDGQPLPTIRTAQPIAALALSEDAAHLHVALADGQVAQYRTADGALLETRAAGEPVAALALSADGRRLTALCTKKICQWSVAPASPRLRLSGHTAHIYGLDFSPDGSKLASAGADQLVMLWNTADGANYATAKGHGSPVYAVAFRPDGAQLASCGLDRTIRLWNPADGAQQRELKEEIADGLYTLAYHRDGARLLSAGLAKVWQEWDPTQDKPLRTVAGHTDPIYRVAYNAAGTRIATVGYTGQLRVWNAADGAQLLEEQLPVPTAYSLAWSPSGTELALGTVDHRVLIWRVPEAVR